MRAVKCWVTVLAVAVLPVAPAAAQQFEEVPQAESQQTRPAAAPGRIAVLNVQFAMANTQEGKKAREELEAQFNPMQTELQTLQREIRDLENQLRTQERTLSDQARSEIIRELEGKRKLANRKQEDLRDELQDAERDYVNQIGEKMQRVIDQYAREKGLSLVLNQAGGNVVWWDDSVVITADIITLYDQMYPVQKAASGTQGGTPPRESNRPR